jgi:hypothetical protein
VDFTLELTDLSGVYGLGVWCGSWDGNPRSHGAGMVSWEPRERQFLGSFGFAEWNGDVQHPIIIVPVAFAEGAIPGDYTCEYQSMDNIGRGDNIWNTSPLLPQVTVSRSGYWDDTAPQVESFELSKTSFDSFSSATNVVATIRVTDSSPIVSAGVRCDGGGSYHHSTARWSSSENNFITRHSVNGGESSGDSSEMSDWFGTRQDATFRLPIVIPRNSKAGTYTCFVQSGDSANNWVQHKDQSIAVTVTRVTPNEETPPVISNVSMNQDYVDVGTGQDVVTFTVTVSDESKIQGVDVYCRVNEVNFSKRLHLVNDAYFLIESYPTSDVPATYTGSTRNLSAQIPVTFSDYAVPGKYECNVAARDQYDNYGNYPFEVEVIRTTMGLPQSPTTVRFVSTVNRPTEGTLSWNAPSVLGTPVLTDYAIQYSFDRVKWVSIADSVSTSTSSIIKNLTANTNYWFRVRAINGKVSSGTPGAPWSKPISISTPSAIAPDAPTNLQLTRKSATSVTAKWTPPAYSGGVPVTDYLIQISSNGGSTWQTVAHPVTTKTTMILSTLTSGRTYQIKVSAVNSAGTSLACEGVYAN